jgi:hypothetical protein
MSVLMQARDTWSAAATLPSAVTRSLMIELDARLSMIMAGGGSVAAKSSMSNATNKPSAPRSSVPCSSTSAAASRTPTPSINVWRVQLPTVAQQGSLFACIQPVQYTAFRPSALVTMSRLVRCTTPCLLCVAGATTAVRRGTRRRRPRGSRCACRPRWCTLPALTLTHAHAHTHTRTHAHRHRSVHEGTRCTPLDLPGASVASSNSIFVWVAGTISSSEPGGVCSHSHSVVSACLPPHPAVGALTHDEQDGALQPRHALV